MDLASFIENNIGFILDDWVRFAKGLGIREALLSEAELLDGIRALLLNMLADMRSPQSALEQAAKSKGERPQNAPNVNRTAQEHAEDRRNQGFTLHEMVAEYRALRASVTRRWVDHVEHAARPYLEEPASLNDLVRFNEAVDQALTESIDRYSSGLTRTRDLFEGVLAHDLRSPLQAINMSATFLSRPGAPTSAIDAAGRIQRSAARMELLIQHLLDFARTRLGDALPIHPRSCDLGEICNQVVDEVTASNSDRRIDVVVQGDLHGDWDSDRLAQIFSNVIGNALQHGDPHAKILIEMRPEKGQVIAAITNKGPAIPPDALRSIFDPLRRAAPVREVPRPPTAGVGLGLYIVKEIAIAHGGSVIVASNEERTTFTLRLPRAPVASD